jgi:hypothetical protein
MDDLIADYVAALAPGYFASVVRKQASLHRLVARSKRLDHRCLNDIFETAQRLSLDAPIFGFEAIGAAAREIQQLVASVGAAPSQWDILRLESLVSAFDDAVDEAEVAAKRATAPRLARLAPVMDRQVA